MCVCMLCMRVKDLCSVCMSVMYVVCANYVCRLCLYVWYAMVWYVAHVWYLMYVVMLCMYVRVCIDCIVPLYVCQYGM